jgi:hypothetical protein
VGKCRCHGDENLVLYTAPLVKTLTLPNLDFKGGTRAQVTPFDLAPKATANGTPQTILADELRQLNSGKLHLYLWGWASYYDRFPGTPQHFTYFCREIRVLIPNEVTLTGCPNGNCIDEECESYGLKAPVVFTLPFVQR